MSTQEIRDGVLHELNPVLVAEIDAFADMLEQRNLARDAAVCLEQELAAAEAENKQLQKRLSRVACVQYRTHAEDGERYVSVADLLRALDLPS